MIWAYLILGVALLVLGVFIARWYATAPTTNVANILRWGGFGLAGALAIFLAVTGKVHLAVIPIALVLLLRLLGWLSRGGGMRVGGQPSPGQTSAVETRYLRMTLEHDSGEMTGEVLEGRYVGRTLGDLSFEQLADLHRECVQGDHQSAQLLEAYLERNFGADWAAKAGTRKADTAGSSGRTAGRSSAAMSKEEACEILGVGPDAAEDEIKAAHHRLMLKLHPDQGGSTYLAGKINRAKEVLLES